MRWFPFVFACVLAGLWWCLCRMGHQSTYTTVTTSLLVGLMMEAWFRIPPRGLDRK